MFIIRTAIDLVSDVFKAIADGANEVACIFNPRKRPRSSATPSPATATPPPFPSPLPPHHNYSPHHNHYNRTSTSPVFSPAVPPAPASPYHPAATYDDLQPRAKRRRVSFPDNPAIVTQQQLPPTPASAPHQYQYQQQQGGFFSPRASYNIQSSPSQAPFGAIRRSSSGLGDALQAPTPPQLSFASRSRINDNNSLYTNNNNNNPPAFASSHRHRPLPSTFIRNNNNNNNRSSNAYFNQMQQKRLYHQRQQQQQQQQRYYNNPNRFVTSPFHQPTARPSAYNSSARTLHFEPRPIRLSNQHLSLSAPAVGPSSAASTGAVVVGSAPNNNKNPTTTATNINNNITNVVKKTATVSASSGGAAVARSNSNFINTFPPPMYPRAGGIPGGAATASMSNVMSHHQQRRTNKKQSTTDLKLMMGAAATAIGGEFSMSHSHHHHGGAAASTTARPTATTVAAAAAKSQQHQNGGQRKSSRNDTAEKEKATQQRLPATFLDLAARGAEIRGRRRSLSDLGVGARAVTGASSLLGVDKGKDSKEKEEEDEEAREMREVRQSVLEDDKQRRLSEDELTKKMARSKQRSSELYLEMFVCAQQRLQDIKRRQDAKRNLERRTQNADKWRDQLYPEEEDDDDDDDEFDESVEELPPSDAKHWNINYYTDVDGTARSWIEESDEQACYERAHQISVIQHQGDDDDDDDDDDEQAHHQQRTSTSPYAPLTDAALRRLRNAFVDRSNEHRVLADINGCEITGGCIRMLQPNRWLNDEVINAYTSLITRRNEAARERVMNGVGGGGEGGGVIKQQQNGHGYHVANGCGRNGGGSSSAGGSNSSSAGNKENSGNNNGASSNSRSSSKKKKKKKERGMGMSRKDKYTNKVDGDGVPLGNGKASSSTRFIPPRIKMMNSFFYSKLVQFDRRQDEFTYRYANVRRWTRREDVFANDLMLVPINKHNVHWTLGVIDFRERVVMHLDSMGTGGDPDVCQHLLDWVRDEARERGKYESHWQNGKEWRMVQRDVPAQGNTDDCGVFLCKFADFLCRGWTEFGFSQKHMKYFRARIAHELLIGKAT